MCISKRFANTGKTGNHGMQEVDVLHRRMIEDKYDQESNDMTILCHAGCEFTLLGEEIPLREALILGKYIRANNLCPFCRTSDFNGVNRIDFEFCAKNQELLQAFTFSMEDKKYETMYKPAGYKFLPADMAEDKE